MIKQTKGKIFLSDERGINETEWFRSCNTFNFGRYRQEHKQPFGPMYVLNDDSLAGHSTLKMLIEESSFVILLPVSGAIQYKNNRGQKNLLAAGQAQLIYAAKGDAVEISNPFGDEWVNFLQIWIRHNGEVKKNELLTYEDVNRNINQLISVFSKEQFVMSIGKFNGRAETVYKAAKENSGLFFFVLEGAFEVEGRLLHARDGLALYDLNTVEMEALSEDAILLVLELPLDFTGNL